jgi:hypothetical protein
MKSARIFHAIGGWALVVMGLAHTTARIHFEFAERTPEHQRVIDMMDATPLAPTGGATFGHVFMGMSTSFSLFALALGTLALMVGRRAADRPDVLQPVRILLAVFLAIETAISVAYFIPPPTILLTIATLSFLISAVAARRS